jgi:hypothetical protein
MLLRIRINFNADPDGFFCLNADPDPDPGSQTNADPDPDPGQTLPPGSLLQGPDPHSEYGSGYGSSSQINAEHLTENQEKLLMSSKITLCFSAYLELQLTFK